MKNNKLSLFALVAVVLGAGVFLSAPKAMASDGDFDDRDFKKEVRVRVDKDFDNGLSAADFHRLMAVERLGMLPGHNFGLLADNDFKKEVRIKVERDNDDFDGRDFKREVRIKVDNDRDFDHD